jgi:hypothetical protein
MVQPVYQSGIYCLPKWYAVVTEKWYTVGYRLQLNAGHSLIVLSYIYHSEAICYESSCHK